MKYNDMSMKKLGILAMFLLAVAGRSYGQASPDAAFKAKVIPPSPEAASLGKY